MSDGTNVRIMNDKMMTKMMIKMQKKNYEKEAKDLMILNVYYNENLPYYIEKCHYTKYLIDILKICKMIKNKNDFQKTNNLSEIVYSFNHIMNRHELLSIKGNKKIVKYFNEKIGKCSINKNKKCQNVLIHIRDIENNQL